MMTSFKLFKNYSTNENPNHEKYNLFYFLQVIYVLLLYD